MGSAPEFLPHRLTLLLQLRHLCNLLIKQTIPGPRIPRPRPPFTKQLLNLLQRFPRRLRIKQESLNRRPKTKDAKDDESLPTDIMESGRNEEPQGEVEQPIRDGRQSHPGGSGLEAPDLGRVDPGDGGQGEGVDDDEEVGEGDDDVGRGSGDLDDDVLVSAHAAWDVAAVAPEDASDDELTDAHADGAVDE